MRLTLPSATAPVIIDSAPGRILIDAPAVTIRGRQDAELLFRAIVEAMHDAGWLDDGGRAGGGGDE